MHKQKMFVLIAAAIGLVGIVLPWAKVEVLWMSVSQNGFSSGFTGWGTLAALGAAAGVLFKDADKNAPISAETKKIVIGSGAAAVVLPILFMILLKAQEGGEFASYGIGLFLSLIGGAGVLAIPLAMKADGSFEMPTKDSIEADIKGEGDDAPAGDDATA